MWLQVKYMLIEKDPHHIDIGFSEVRGSRHNIAKTQYHSTINPSKSTTLFYTNKSNYIQISFAATHISIHHKTRSH